MCLEQTTPDGTPQTQDCSLNGLSLCLTPRKKKWIYRSSMIFVAMKIINPLWKGNHHLRVFEVPFSPVNPVKCWEEDVTTGPNSCQFTRITSISRWPMEIRPVGVFKGRQGPVINVLSKGSARSSTRVVNGLRCWSSDCPLIPHLASVPTCRFWVDLIGFGQTKKHPWKRTAGTPTNGGGMGDSSSDVGGPAVIFVKYTTLWSISA